MNHSRLRVTFATLSIAVISFALVQAMSIPVISEIARRYDSSASTANWILTGYLLSAAVATPIMGRIGDAVGKVRMLVASLAALCVGSIIAAVAPTIEVLIVARIIQGIGGGVLPLSFGIVRDSFPARHVARVVGFMSSLMAVGFAVGLVVAGPALDAVGLTGLFVLPAILTGAAMLAATWLRTRPQERSSARFSVRAAVLLATWLTLLLLGVTAGPEYGWLSPLVLGMLVGAVLTCGGWIWSELRAKVPVVDMRLMANPPVAVANLVAVLAGFGAYAAYGFLPQFVQTPTSDGFGFGASVTLSGVIMLPSAAATFLAGIIAVPLASRFGSPLILVLASVLAAAGSLALVVAPASMTAMYVSSGLVGLGMGIVFACLAAVVVVAVPASQTGIASGMNANLRIVGGAVGVATVTTIVSAHVDPVTGQATLAGYLAGFMVLTVVFVVAAAAAFALFAAERRPTARVVR